MSETDELPPSKLGTKEHWDSVYQREVGVFEETGDEGEIWFGESSVQKMVKWSIQHLPPTLPQFISSGGPTILECGCGNGTLLLEYLKPWVRSAIREQAQEVEVRGEEGANRMRVKARGYMPQDLTGVDYSEGSVELAKRVEQMRRENGWKGADDYSDSESEDEDEEEETVATAEREGEEAQEEEGQVTWRQVDLLDSSFQPSEKWDLVLDKGTFDALALSQEPVEGDSRLPSVVYPEKVAGLVKPGGFFLITSCNFTEEEVKKRFGAAGLTYHSTVPQPKFQFGGKSGTSVATVAFQKA